MLDNGSLILNINEFAKDGRCPTATEIPFLSSLKEGDHCNTHHTMAPLQGIPG